LTNRVGFVDNEETTSLGKLERNAPRQLIVRGTCHVLSVEGLKLDWKMETNAIEANTLQANLTHQLSSLH
jgi:hypothetical protein